MTLLFFLLFLHSQRIIWPSLLTTPTIQSTAVTWKRFSWKSSSERWRRICATSQYWASPISSCWRTWIRTPSPTSQGGTSSSSWRKLQAGKRTWAKLKICETTVPSSARATNKKACDRSRERWKNKTEFHGRIAVMEIGGKWIFYIPIAQVNT